MNSTKEMLPSFEQVVSINDSQEFLKSFCNKALELIEEFKKKYSQAIAEKDQEKLSSITHKIASTMKWLDLDGFLSLTKSYKDLSLSDPDEMLALLKDVLYHSDQIEEAIKSKLEEL